MTSKERTTGLFTRPLRLLVTVMAAATALPLRQLLLLLLLALVLLLLLLLVAWVLLLQKLTQHLRRLAALLVLPQVV